MNTLNISGKEEENHMYSLLCVQSNVTNHHNFDTMRNLALSLTSIHGVKVVWEWVFHVGNGIRGKGGSNCLGIKREEADVRLKSGVNSTE